MSMNKDLKKGIELSDEELMDMVGGVDITGNVIVQPLYGIIPTIKYGVVVTKYGVQPLYGIKPIDIIQPLYGIKPTEIK